MAERDDKSAPSEVAYVLDALKVSFDEEFQTSERLTSKARQVFALSAGFFTLVQTVAFSNFKGGDVRGCEKTILLIAAITAILVLAIAAWRTAQADRPLQTHRYPLWLLVTALNAIQIGSVEFPSEDKRSDPKIPPASKPKSLVRRGAAWLFGPLPEPPDFDTSAWFKRLLTPDPDAPKNPLARSGTPAQLANYFITLTQSRRLANEIRYEGYKRVRALAAISVTVTTLELMWSLYARLA